MLVMGVYENAVGLRTLEGLFDAAALVAVLFILLVATSA